MEATTSGIEVVPRDSPDGSRTALRRIALSSDERLVKRVRAGSEEAFATLYERHQHKLLSFCRHMLGSQHEAEDAVQQTFVNAYRDIVRAEKDLRVRPWLYRIARNQCISMLRARRPEAELGADEPSLQGLSEEVAARTDLRELLDDLASLPPDQREALVLAELHDNSHAQVAEILGCEREKVKSLVFQARSSLLKSREARDISCEVVQRQLSVLRGGSLRRSVLRRHLNGCAACRHFHEEVRRQRAALALILPVAPSAGLKPGAASAIAAASGAGGPGGGAAASGGVGGSLTSLAAKVGLSGAALKGTVAAVAVTTAVAGGAAGVEVARHASDHSSTPAATALQRSSTPGTERVLSPGAPGLHRGRVARHRGKASGASGARRHAPGARVRAEKRALARGEAHRAGVRPRPSRTIGGRGRAGSHPLRHERPSRAVPRDPAKRTPLPPRGGRRPTVGDDPSFEDELTVPQP
jgi:RNA polymerase sigma factor (sigma-70 family)